MGNINEAHRHSTGAGKILVLDATDGSNKTYTRSTHGEANMIQCVTAVTLTSYTIGNQVGGGDTLTTAGISFPAGASIPCNMSTFVLASGQCIVHLSSKLNLGITTLPTGIKSE